MCPYPLVLRYVSLPKTHASILTCAPSNVSRLTSGPDTPSELLALAAERLGWCRLKLQWARPGSLSDGITVRLDLNRVEHLQCLASLCRFSDFCQAAKASGPHPGETTASATLEPRSPSIVYSLSGDGGEFALEPKGNALSQVWSLKSYPSQ